MILRAARRLFGSRPPPSVSPPATDVLPAAVADAWSLLQQVRAPSLPAPATELAPAAPEAIALDHEAPIAVFGPDDLPPFASFEDLARRLLDPDAGDGCFRHAPETPIHMVPGGLEAGRNLFGPGRLNPALGAATGIMRGVSSSLLHRAIVSGQSTSVHSLGRGFFEPSVKLLMNGGGLATVARLEPFYEADGTGQVRVRRNQPPMAPRDGIAVPICGVGFHNYGHFLYDGLPAALLYRAALPGVPLRLVGNVLAQWQRRLLQNLGLLELYDEVVQPACFSRVLTSDLVSLHVSYPTRFVRPVFDMLRFLLAPMPAIRQRTVFLSRGSDTTRRVLTNRAEVERALAAEGVEIVQPERLDVAQQVALAASCRFVIGEAGAGMANVGFCDPGTSVLEIQHEDGPDGWTRAACRMMGLRWHIYVAQTDHAALAAHGEPKPHGMFVIDVPSLVAAVRAIRATL